MGTYVDYGYSWKCTKCGKVTTLLFCDNFTPTCCGECNGPLINTPKEEVDHIAKELHNELGR